MVKSRKAPKLQRQDGLIDPDDPVGSIERLHPPCVVSFGLWHELRPGYADTAQTCISNEKWGTGKCWVEMFGPDDLPDFFMIKADNTVEGVKFPLPPHLVHGSPSRVKECVFTGDITGDLFLPWDYICQMLICPGRETTPMMRVPGEKRKFDKKDTWFYLTAFFGARPPVLYFHVWPSEVRKFYAAVRAAAAKKKDHATPIH